MPKTINDFLGYGVGDILTLSDLQTQTEFNQLKVDYTIKEIRTYKEPNGVFIYVGYMIQTSKGQNLMVLVKTMGKDFEPYIFYMDTGAPLYQAAGNQPPCPLYCLLTDDLKDLIMRMDAQVPNDDGSGSHPVTWDRQTLTHGVEYEDTADVEGICTLGEYFTNDQNGGNNFCLIDWKGDAAKGFIEVWYGCQIKNSELDLVHK